MNFSFSNLFGGGNQSGANQGNAGNPGQNMPSGNNDGSSGAANIFNNAGNRMPANNQQVNNGPGSSLENPGGQQGNQNFQGQQGNQGPQDANSQLAEMAKLWENDPTKQGTQPPTDPFAEPLFTMDPKKLAESSKQLDFTGQISPELMQKALGGDSQALVQLINEVAQKSVSTSLQMATMLTEQAGAKMGQRFKSGLPNQMRQFQLDNTTPQNAILQNPAVSPMMKLVQERFAVNNPGMRPAEIQAKAEQYMLDMAAAIRADVGRNTEADSGPFSNSPKQPGVTTDFSDW